MLDEIGDMPMRLQVKLLRVLQENVIRPVGNTDAIPVNVRVISATHRDLQQLLSAEQFREDLYYRLNVVHIEMPPLNRRREDIPLLVAHFLAQIAKESGVRKIYAPEAVELLATADWPGNIRQLQNVVRQNVALSQTPIIPVELVQQSLGGARTSPCWSRTSWRRSRRKAASVRSMRPKRSSCSPRPIGRATSASCRMSCGRTWRCRRPRSSPSSSCSSPSAAAPGACPPSMRRATSSPAATCRRSCRSRAAT